MRMLGMLVRRSTALALGSVVALASCGGDEEASLTINLEGTVTDVFGQPVEGATVTVSNRLAGRNSEQTTDENGRYELRFDGFGTFSVNVTADGYARHQSSFGVADVPDVFGEFGAGAVRDVRLYETNGSLRGQITRPRGDAAALDAVPLRLRFSDSSVQDPTISTETTTDSDGRYEFTGLPTGLNATLFIPSHDADGDGNPDTAANSSNVFLNYESATVLNRTVGDFEGPRAVWSNANSTLVEADSSVDIYYSVPMETDVSRRTVRLRQISPNSLDVFEETSFSSDGLVLTVDPMAPLTPGARYNLSVTTFSSSTQQQVNSNYTFNVATDETGPAAPMNLRRDDDGREITFGQVTFQIAWDTVARAERYRIYMRIQTNEDVSDWIQAADLASSFGPVMRRSISAPFALRQRTGRLFDNGGTLMVAVSALVDGIEGALSAPLMLQDEDCPRIFSVFNSPSVSWNNTGGTEAIDVGVAGRFSEPLDLSSSIQLTLAAAGVDAATFNFVWLDDFNGRFEGQVPAGVDGSELATIDITGATDRSGNTVCEGGEMASVTLF